MGLGELFHLFFEQGPQTGSPQIESSWQIISFGPHSFWKIGTFHIKIHLPSFFLKIRLSGNPQWQFFCMAKSDWIWVKAVLYRGVLHWLLPIPYCLKCSSLQSSLAIWPLILEDLRGIALITFPWIHIAFHLADHFYALCLRFLTIFYFFLLSQSGFSLFFI